MHYLGTDLPHDRALCYSDMMSETMCLDAGPPLETATAEQCKAVRSAEKEEEALARQLLLCIVLSSSVTVTVDYNIVFSSDTGHVD